MEAPSRPARSCIPGRLPGSLTLALVAVLALPAAVLAIAPVAPSDHAGLAPVDSDELAAGPTLTIYEMGSADVAGLAPLERFLDRYPGAWEVRWDERSDRPHVIQGRGVPLIPGAGNRLRPGDIGLAADATVRLADLERLLRGFMDDYPELFRVDPRQLVLDPKASGPYRDFFWNVEFGQVVAGVPVERAKVFFRINHGNVVQFGTSRLADVAIPTRPELDRLTAQSVALERAGVAPERLTELVEPGRLLLFPALDRGERRGHRFQGTPGSGYGHRLVWEVVFRRQGDHGTYRALVDAHDGRLLQLLDRNRYAKVKGGVYPESSDDTIESRDFPFAALTEDGVDKETDASGDYNYEGGTASSSLDGVFVSIDDDCGDILLENDTDGELDFMSSAGTDCDTPAEGGDGNTHSTRTGFYHLTRVNRQADGHYPNNAWIDGTLTANMNINRTCNAFWNGSSVNFYRSGGGCNNTGEISDVFIHEWGHGLDDNVGSSTPDNGSGEAYADTLAFIYNGNSCIGENFRTSDCHNCTDCTGVRDIGAFASGGGATIASPAEVEDNNGIDCDRWACPLGYRGPMGYEGHCESYIASTANWDLRGSIGAGTFEDLWYGSLTSTGAAYRIESGGECNPGADIDGCEADNWYTAFLTVDDDDGDISNGTPHCGEIFDAFDAHGIACGERCDPGGEEVCDNGTDDDGDGLIDCDDPDCADDPACDPGGEEICDNGVDDDGDGMIDCADPDCADDPACDPCNLGLNIRNRTVRAGEVLYAEVGLQHNRPLAVDASFRMWIEDSLGQFVVGTESIVHTFELGDLVHLEPAIPVPAGQAPGEYVLIVAIGEMQQGVARREKSFTVVE